MTVHLLATEEERQADQRTQRPHQRMGRNPIVSRLVEAYILSGILTAKEIADQAGLTLMQTSNALQSLRLRGRIRLAVLHRDEGGQYGVWESTSMVDDRKKCEECAHCHKGHCRAESMKAEWRALQIPPELRPLPIRCEAWVKR